MRIVLLFLLSIFSISVRAQIPGTNYAELIEQLTGNAQFAQQYSQYTDMYKKINENIGKLSGMTVDANNNAMANWTIRSNQSKADIQNLEIKQKLTPAIGACLSATASKVENPCPRRAFVEGLFPTNWERASAVAGSLGQQSGVSYRMGSVLERMEQKYTSAFRSTPPVAGVESGSGQSSGHLGSGGGGSGLSGSEDSVAEGEEVIPIEPVAMLSGDFQYLTLFEEDMQATVDFIDLIAPPFVYTLPMQAKMNIDPRHKIKFMNEHAMKDAARVSLQELASLRNPSEAGLSTLSAMQDFADTQTSLAEKIGYSNIAVPSVVWRNIAIMRAFQVHMALERYKLSLKREGIVALDFRKRMAID